MVQRCNPLVDHVGIHGQRRLTEALNKESLVRQKEYPMESSSKSRKRVFTDTKNATPNMSPSSINA
ncbi:hypothetical protein Taro_014317 [Colocasia esculenta]|uniref:Uncharacterized protein n=1 Tax=Colocasia esculenta TaxID=4460 RepID=A0A843ULG6_COLES|nr:hypothetical protein [Colocasia esculenta]